MSYHLVYVFEDPNPPEDGDALASGAGWLNWGEYVAGMAEHYPESDYLAEYGEWEPTAGWEDLEHELEELIHADDPDAAAVSTRLLAAVKGRPDGCVGLLVTDGTDPGDDGDDDDGSA